ncbi:hypothetical protein M23134_05809 [Microscilla marina ATCC 23134]|uniref:Uncharacterized protein n=1 Tax=Microscilla marina ATCC 23134 TaxID=313606 RepID=A1ZIR8_MICM2|nr:hypothetical protein M23134_05809 [Microscilla marina ATCC 23134]
MVYGKKLYQNAKRVNKTPIAPMHRDFQPGWKAEVGFQKRMIWQKRFS